MFGICTNLQRCIYSLCSIHVEMNDFRVDDHYDRAPSDGIKARIQDDQSDGQSIVGLDIAVFRPHRESENQRG